MPPGSVRAVATNTLRVAKNARLVLSRFEAALGFPIEVVAGREEARLIYLGVAHSLPPTQEKRLVVDIGGGSTEFIVGAGHQPHRLESLYMGCVSWTLRFFPEGRLSKSNLKHAELVRSDGLDASYERFVADKLDALAGLRPRLAADVTKLPGARILDGRFTAIQQAIGAPKGRPGVAQWLQQFVDEVKASGFVAELILRNGAHGLTVAPVG